MNEELLLRIVADTPTAGAIMLAWFLFARKHSQGLARIHDRIDRFLTSQLRLMNNQQRTTERLLEQTIEAKEK